MATPSEEVASAARHLIALRDQVAAHKAAIRHHRAELAVAAAALDAFETACRARGIVVTHCRATTAGEGVIHGPHRSRP